MSDVSPLVDGERLKAVVEPGHVLDPGQVHGGRTETRQKVSLL
jgi:hypothetical protein